MCRAVLCVIIDVLIVELLSWSMQKPRCCAVCICLDFQHGRRLCDMERKVLASSVRRVWCSGYGGGHQVSHMKMSAVVICEFIVGMGFGGRGG